MVFKSNIINLHYFCRAKIQILCWVYNSTYPYNSYFKATDKRYKLLLLQL